MTIALEKCTITKGLSSKINMSELKEEAAKH